MASAPATALVETGSANMPVTVTAEPSNELFSGFVNLNLVRQLALMIGLAASVAIGFAVVLWSQNEDYQPIYGNMEGYDLTVLMETLDSEQIQYRIAPNTGVILVPSDDISSVRLRLAAAGISRFDGTGYELLDEEQGLGTSQSMEASRLKRSQEGELQRTIASFKNIQSARVHIAIPERSVFVRSSRKPTASVFLVLNSAASLADTQTSAIANLVASSIPELNKEDVTIVDQRGNLLTRIELNTPMDVAGRQFEYVQRLEGSMVARVNSILLPIVGIDGFKAEVTANVDFTQSEQADEIYDPETQVVRSEQSMSEQRAGADREGGVAGALSNQPPLDGTAPEVATGGAGSQADSASATGNSRQQSTRNYELGRTISYTNHDPVDIKRLSVAVVVDHRPAVDSEEAIPWTEDELAQLTTLVKDAVGFDEERGDRVTVMNNAFSRIEVIPDVPVALWQQAWVMGLAKQLSAGIFVLLLALGVLRPVLKNIANGSSASRQLALPATQGGFAGAGSEAALAAPVQQVIVNKPDGYEAQLKAVKGIVAEDPSRVAQVVKQWISEDGGQ